MTTTLKVIIALSISILLLGCASYTGNNQVGTKKKAAVSTSQSYVKNYGPNDTTRLFVFVGEKISVEPLPHEQGSMDNAFRAKYAILKKVYGGFLEDTIEFVAYDHYGIPPFSKFKNVLLYVSADSGTYYHQKYLYNDVYKTKENRWAGTFAGEDYDHPYNRSTDIKPTKIDFAQKVFYTSKKEYPTPYFKKVGDSAIAVYGNYVEELFALKKSGFLAARGLFNITAAQEEDLVISRQPAEPLSPHSADDSTFLAFWDTVVQSINDNNLKNFKSIALDTLYICDNPVSTSNFLDKCFHEVIDDEVRKRIIDSTKLAYSSSNVELHDLLTTSAKKEIIMIDNGYRLRQMLVTRSTKNNNPPTVVFNFIDTPKGYRLYGIDHHWFKECCR